MICTIVIRATIKITLLKFRAMTAYQLIQVRVLTSRLFDYLNHFK